MEVYWEEADVDAVIRMSMQTALPGVDLSASETVYACTAFRNCHLPDFIFGIDAELFRACTQQ